MTIKLKTAVGIYFCNKFDFMNIWRILNKYKRQFTYRGSNVKSRSDFFKVNNHSNVYIIM